MLLSKSSLVSVGQPRIWLTHEIGIGSMRRRRGGESRDFVPKWVC